MELFIPVSYTHLQDANKCLEIMAHYKELSELLKEMAKRAGDRVVLKA